MLMMLNHLARTPILRALLGPAVATAPLGAMILLGGLAAPMIAQAQAPAPAQAQAESRSAAQPQALAILTRAAERYEGMTGFCAEFRQVVENEILRQTTRSRGELCQRRPDRFEMRFTDPAGDRVVADGRHLWAYFPSTNPGQAFRTDPGTAEGRFDLHREFLSQPGERYAPTLEGEETIDGRRTHRMMLRPTGNSPFLRARIWVDASDSMIRKIEIVETEGFVRTVELTGLRVNPSLPDARFIFEVPTGVRVVSR
ncbi:MAG: outer membrane lipoprotein carrier protein LolA [Gemmatimonadales bacterium]|nr:MAG: outer membrane lipoprotein carrier protein LolA [Gemmatimonadales bacterium]